MPPVWVGAIRASMVRTGSGMSKWRAGEVGDHLVGLALHPLPQRVGAVQLVCRVAVEVVDGLLDASARHDPVGGGAHLGGDPGELLLPPGVGLLEVDRGAEEVS